MKDSDQQRIVSAIRPVIHEYFRVVQKEQTKPSMDALLEEFSEAARVLFYGEMTDADRVTIKIEESIHFVEVKVTAFIVTASLSGISEREVEVTITEPKYGGISPDYLSAIYPGESSEFLHDAILFAKGLYGQWDDLRGMVALYQHHYAATDRIYVYEGNFFNIIRVLMPAMEAAGIVVTHDEYAKMLKLVFQRDLDSALGILVSKLTLIPIARVNNVPLMWGTNQIVASVLLPYVKAKEA